MVIRLKDTFISIQNKPNNTPLTTNHQPNNENDRGKAMLDFHRGNSVRNQGKKKKREERAKIKTTLNHPSTCLPLFPYPSPFFKKETGHGRPPQDKTNDRGRPTETAKKRESGDVR